MTDPAIDHEKLRRDLRTMSRGDLLIIAERAAELMPRAKLETLLGDYVPVNAMAKSTAQKTPLLSEVQAFYRESLDGRYFQSFDVNAKNCTGSSVGTDAFIAEFHRLLGKCVRAAGTRSRKGLLVAFDLLLRLLEHIDEAHDDLVFFADEPGAWQVGIVWREVFPAYFRCLAETASSEEFARTVDQRIKSFAEHDRPQHIATARKVASTLQLEALRLQLSGDVPTSHP